MSYAYGGLRSEVYSYKVLRRVVTHNSTVKSTTFASENYNCH